MRPRSRKTRKQMAEHLVRPVEFVAEIEAMYQDGARVFVEVGPKAILSRLTAKILAERPHRAISIDDGGGLAGLLGALGQLACAGVAVDLRPLFDRRVVPRSATRISSNRWCRRTPCPSTPGCSTAAVRAVPTSRSGRSA